jgi:hypothetical protein
MVNPAEALPATTTQGCSRCGQRWCSSPSLNRQSSRGKKVRVGRHMPDKHATLRNSPPSVAGSGRASEPKRAGNAGASKRQLLAKEGHDNTALLKRALAPATGHQAGTGAIPAHNPLQQLADRIGSETADAGEGSTWQQGAHFAAHVPRHMLSSLLGGALPAEEPPNVLTQLPAARTVHLASPPHPAAAGANFMQRNSQRLGGQGVASLLTGAGPTHNNRNSITLM